MGSSYGSRFHIYIICIHLSVLVMFHASHPPPLFYRLWGGSSPCFNSDLKYLYPNQSRSSLPCTNILISHFSRGCREMHKKASNFWSNLFGNSHFVLSWMLQMLNLITGLQFTLHSFCLHRGGIRQGGCSPDSRCRYTLLVDWLACIAYAPGSS